MASDNIRVLGQKQVRLGAVHMREALLAGWFGDMWFVQFEKSMAPYVQFAWVLVKPCKPKQLPCGSLTVFDGFLN